MRFSLQTLLLAVVVVASATGAFGVVGFVLALIGLPLGAYIAAAKSKLEATVIVVIVVVFVLLLLPQFQSRGGHPAWTHCPNILKQIALAIHNYHDVHGCLPPAYIPDEQGNPMHSWRVLLLPYLEEKDLYDQYDFSEPWDGPNNRRLAAHVPDVYRCQAKRLASASSTADFVAVVGRRTVWPGSEPTRFGDVSDGTDRTILAIEIADSDIHWMEPRDISFEEFLSSVDPQSGSALLNVHESGRFMNRRAFTHVSLADGSCRRLRADVAPDLLKALLTAAGGEPIDQSRFDFVTLRGQPPRRSAWTRSLAVLALVLSVGLLVGRRWVRGAFSRRRR